MTKKKSQQSTEETTNFVKFRRCISKIIQFNVWSYEYGKQIKSEPHEQKIEGQYGRKKYKKNC